jgi:hypothetical protein
MDLRVARMARHVGSVDRRCACAPGTTYQAQRKAPNALMSMTARPPPWRMVFVSSTAPAPARAYSFRPAGYGRSFRQPSPLPHDIGTQRRVIVDIAGRARIQ